MATSVTLFSLKGAPALIERLLPVQKLSAEAYKEQMAGSGKTLTVRGARENNLKNVDVVFPLGKMVAITGASGAPESCFTADLRYLAASV